VLSSTGRSELPDVSLYPLLDGHPDLFILLVFFFGSLFGCRNKRWAPCLPLFFLHGQCGIEHIVWTTSSTPFFLAAFPSTLFPRSRNPPPLLLPALVLGGMLLGRSLLCTSKATLRVVSAPAFSFAAEHGPINPFSTYGPGGCATLPFTSHRIGDGILKSRSNSGGVFFCETSSFPPSSPTTGVE